MRLTFVSESNRNDTKVLVGIGRGEFIVRERLKIKNSKHNFKLNLKTKREQVCSLRFSSFSKNLEKDIPPL